MKRFWMLMASLAVLAWAGDWIPRETVIPVKTSEAIQSRANQSGGKIFSGTLTNDVFDKDGNRMASKGSPAELIVRQTGKEEAVVDLESIMANGHRYAISIPGSESEGVQQDDIKKHEGAFVGGGAMVGSLVDAAPGTRGKMVDIPAGATLMFRLEQPLRVEMADPGYNRDGRHYHAR